MQLENLISTYPPIDDDKIQELITAKYEFSELASTEKEEVPNPGEFFKHQIFLNRFSKVWDRAMIIHETGTGKSYLAGALGQTAKKENKKRRGIQHVLILVKGETQQTDMNTTLICKSTGGDYLTPAILKAVNAQAAKNRITRSLGRWYTVRRYREFASSISDKSDNEIIAMFSDWMIIIDEIHNLRLITDNEQNEDLDIKETKKTYNAIWKLTHLPHRIKVFGMTATIVINQVQEFASVMNLILPINRQIPPFSNPMKNLLPSDYKMPKDEDMETISSEDLYNKYTKGMISYVRALNTGVYLKREGEIYKTHFNTTHKGITYDFDSMLTLYPLTMGENQSIVYLAAYNLTLQSKNSFHIPDIAASSWIYPDNTWGYDAFFRHYDEIEDPNRKKKTSTGTDVKDKKTGWYKPRKSMMYYYENTEKLSELSIKDAKIIDIINETDGVVVIYDSIVHGGILDLAIALEHMGYDRFVEVESVFKSSSSGNNLICSSGEKESREIKSDFLPQGSKKGKEKQKPRFAIFTQSAKRSITHILSIATSDENKNGEYIKVFIITDATKEGISINHMKTYIQRSGVWNASDAYQAQSRGVRSVSHKLFLKDEVERLKKEGKDPKDAKFKIKSYFFIANPGIVEPEENEVRKKDEYGTDQYREINMSYIGRRIDEVLKKNPDIKKEYKGLTNDTPEYIQELLTFSVDLYLQRLAEGKDRSYRRFLRKIKQGAIDCHINYKRNVREDDVDFSTECDYEICHYKCRDPAPKETDYSTYDIYYIDEAIDKIRDDIRRYFTKNSTGTVTQISDIIKESAKLVREKYVSIALTNLVMERIPIKDRYGYNVYIREDNGIYYITREFPTSEAIDNLSLAFYGQNLINEINKPISEALNEEIERKIELVWNELINLDTKQYTNDDYYEEELGNILKQYSIEVEIGILERAVIDFYENNKTLFNKSIMEIYKNVFYSMNEPVTLISNEARKLRTGTIKNANTIVTSAPVRMSFTEKSKIPVTDKKTEVVYYHVIYSHKPLRTKYGALIRIIKAEGIIRIFKPSEGLGWRDVNPVEFIIYNKFAQINIHEITLPFEKNDIYGIITFNGIFDIRDKTKEKPGVRSNYKMSYNGRECYSIERYTLRDYMWSLGIRKTPASWKGVPKNIQKKNNLRDLKISVIASDGGDLQIENIKKTWDDDRIDFYYSWSYMHHSPEEFCKLLMERMEELNLLLRWRKY